MDGFGFAVDHTSRAVDNIFVADRWTFRTGERSYESHGLVSLVHDEANEDVFPPFLVKLDGIEELCYLLNNAVQVGISWLSVNNLK